jgi:glyoxylase-like metal-dependent hydrolase (beta-lactamase superfamily II)
MMAVVDRFDTSLGQPIYWLPVEAFPGFWANAYLVLMGQANVLIDTGSGLANANDQLNTGLEEVRATFDEELHWEDLTHILISHGHIDHFGGLPYIQQRSPALVGDGHHSGARGSYCPSASRGN